MIRPLIGVDTVFVPVLKTYVLHPTDLQVAFTLNPKLSTLYLPDLQAGFTSWSFASTGYSTHPK